MGHRVTGIMIQGTASDVGKSYITAALCRLLAQEGYAVAPFKSQNVTNNTWELADGKEMSMSQYFQAKAAQVEPTVEMNPILLKAQTGKIEVVLLGKRVETIHGGNYRDQFYTTGITIIQRSIAQLAKQYDVIVMEGAGSPVELNLKDRELVNMKVAELADVPVLLVADIHRGGIFASVVGTLALLPRDERNRVKGVIINKFRGDVQMFREGVRLLEKKAGVPVLGVIPFEERGDNIQPAFNDQAQHVQKHLDWEKVKQIIFRWGDK